MELCPRVGDTKTSSIRVEPAVQNPTKRTEEDQRRRLVSDSPDYLPELQLVQEDDGGTTLPSVQSPKIIRGPSDAAASPIRPCIAAAVNRELQSLGPDPRAQFAKLYLESVREKSREDIADPASELSVGEGNEI